MMCRPNRMAPSFGDRRDPPTSPPHPKNNATGAVTVTPCASRPSQQRCYLLSRMLPTPAGPSWSHQIPIWCFQPCRLLCSVNDAVKVLPCSIWAYLNGGPVLTCAALPGRRRVSGRPQTTDLRVGCLLGRLDGP